MVNILVDVDKKLHQKLKVGCAIRGMTLKAYVIDALRERANEVKK